MTNWKVWDNSIFNTFQLLLLQKWKERIPTRKHRDEETIPLDTRIQSYFPEHTRHWPAETWTRAEWQLQTIRFSEYETNIHHYMYYFNIICHNKQDD